MTKANTLNRGEEGRDELAERVQRFGMSVGDLKVLGVMADGLAEAAGAVASLARKKYRDWHYIPRGSIPPCGPQTPLWNELAAALRRLLRRRGDKVRLARYLGISRQRLHLMLVARSAYPDAERTLQLLVWLEARRRGIALDR